VLAAASCSAPASPVACPRAPQQHDRMPATGACCLLRGVRRNVPACHLHFGPKRQGSSCTIGNARSALRRTSRCRQRAKGADSTNDAAGIDVGARQQTVAGVPRAALRRRFIAVPPSAILPHLIALAMAHPLLRFASFVSRGRRHGVRARRPRTRRRGPRPCTSRPPSHRMHVALLLPSSRIILHQTTARDTAHAATRSVRRQRRAAADVD